MQERPNLRPNFTIQIYSFLASSFQQLKYTNINIPPKYNLSMIFTNLPELAIAISRHKHFQNEIKAKRIKKELRALNDHRYPHLTFTKYEIKEAGISFHVRSHPLSWNVPTTRSLTASNSYLISTIHSLGPTYFSNTKPASSVGGRIYSTMSWLAVGAPP